MKPVMFEHKVSHISLNKQNHTHMISFNERLIRNVSQVGIIVVIVLETFPRKEGFCFMQTIFFLLPIEVCLIHSYSFDHHQ
jgi:hypothetical protein